MGNAVISRSKMDGRWWSDGAVVTVLPKADGISLVDLQDGSTVGRCLKF